MVEDNVDIDRRKDTIERFQSPLLAFIRSRVGALADAEDILQEVWLQFAYRDQKDELQSESGWLYRVARNKIIDYYRRTSTEWLEDFMDEEIWEEDEDEMDVDFFWEEFYEALDILPTNQREVFVMNELEGLTLQEIAEATGEKLKTIISRKGYAVRRLRDQLEGFWEEM